MTLLPFHQYLKLPTKNVNAITDVIAQKVDIATLSNSMSELLTKKDLDPIFTNESVATIAERGDLDALSTEISKLLMKHDFDTLFRKENIAKLLTKEHLDTQLDKFSPQIRN
jgi:hypothetical protein